MYGFRVLLTTCLNWDIIYVFFKKDFHPQFHLFTFFEPKQLNVKRRDKRHYRAVFSQLGKSSQRKNDENS